MDTTAPQPGPDPAFELLIEIEDMAVIYYGGRPFFGLVDEDTYRTRDDLTDLGQRAHAIIADAINRGPGPA